MRSSTHAKSWVRVGALARNAAAPMLSHAPINQLAGAAGTQSAVARLALEWLSNECQRIELHCQRIESTFSTLGISF